MERTQTTTVQEVIVKRIRLAQRRRAIGHSQESLAEQLGVDRTTVIRWEHGATEPQPWLRPHIAMALKVSVNELAVLLADEGEAPPVLGIPAHYVLVRADTNNQPSEIEDVNRRSFLAVPGTSLFGALAPYTGTAAQPAQTQVVKHLAAAMLASSTGASKEPAAIAELTKQVMTTWRLRQRASYEDLGHLLPSLITDAHTRATTCIEADQDRLGRTHRAR